MFVQPKVIDAMLKQASTSLNDYIVDHFIEKSHNLRTTTIFLSEVLLKEQ